MNNSSSNLRERENEVINVFKESIAQIKFFQLHSVKAKFLANYLLQFDRLTVVSWLVGLSNAM